jgi:F0F1-type ATP synthase gamma subunit
MSTTLQQIDTEAQELVSLQAMVNVYGDVALSRMAAIRQSVLFARGFLDNLTEVFADVQAAYLKKLEHEGANIAKRKKVTVLSHNGLTVSVLISANTRLYGDLVQRTYGAFMDEYRQQGTEATIIGKIGLSMFKEEMGERHQYTYFDYPDDKVNGEALSDIIAHLVQYEEIHLFYGKYKNVVIQDPTRSVLSASRPMGEMGTASRHAYMFEPSLEEVMRFFEHEIFGTLFDQVMRESILSKFAARLVAMDQADQQIEGKLKKMSQERLMIVHQVANRRQLNSMPSLVRAMRG